MEREESGLLISEGGDERCMLIAFGGLLGQFGIPAYEFMQITRPLPCQRLFVRDHHSAWYHHGVRGLGSSIADVAAALRRLVEERGSPRTVLVGNSSGGYAALMFGALIEADEVHAFSPQTFIAPRLRHRFGDLRWPREYEALLASGGYDPDFGDLRRVAGGANVHIHVSSANRRDMVHAAWMRDRAALHTYRVGGHSFVKALRADGRLERLLTLAVEGEQPDPGLLVSRPLTRPRLRIAGGVVEGPVWRLLTRIKRRLDAARGDP